VRIERQFDPYPKRTRQLQQVGMQIVGLDYDRSPFISEIQATILDTWKGLEASQLGLKFQQERRGVGALFIQRPGLITYVDLEPRVDPSLVALKRHRFAPMVNRIGLERTICQKVCHGKLSPVRVKDATAHLIRPRKTCAGIRP
jgi:hypothetical protein